MAHTTGHWERIGLIRSFSKQLLKHGFKKPTPVQRKSIPYGLKCFNILCISPSGSGKTLAFLLPVIQRIQRSKRSGLILSPTRELALQNLQVARKLIDTAKLECRLLTGGSSRRISYSRPMQNTLIFGTPGKVLELANKRPAHFNQIEMAVLDEFDKLLQLGFGEQIKQISGFLPDFAQWLYFSATEPESFPLKNEKQLKTIKIIPASQSSKQVELIYYLKTAKTKNQLLLSELSSATGPTIIFTKNWKKAAHLSGFLKLNNYNPILFHGKLNQNERFAVLSRFMRGKAKFMVATDLAGRGLDTLHVDEVVNFSLPQNAKDYIHRLGRTGRTGRRGKCVSFASPEDYLEHQKIESGLGYKIPSHPAYGNRDKWLMSAKAKHKTKVRREKRIRQIQTEQKLG